ncbi:hypothetical protein [Desertivirga xinjiangensis]|uniref:DUF7935 family protein n=1 Tax=Desertivirga xinjiangensis TaxID=539206 RepID=UPI00210A0FB4|nr:hypothetical protein [Pedobacter xinjiangensis]
MDILITFLLDILKFTLAGTAVFFIAYSVLKPLIENRQRLKIIELKKAALSTTLPLRLQAYERISLLIERINPSNLLVRLHSPGLSVLQMQQLLTAEIQNEFQHNVTQQVYVSAQAWNMVRRLKDDTVRLINNSAKGLPYDAAAIELNKTILSHMASVEENPYDAALTLIKSDLQEYF